MTKSMIIEKVHAKLGGYSRVEVAKYVTIVFDAMKDALMNYNNVQISGFGNFNVKRKKERMGCNPRSGEKLIIPERWVITFSAGQLMKNKINRKPDDMTNH